MKEKGYEVDGHRKFVIEFREEPDGTIRPYATVRPRDPYNGTVGKTHVHEDGRLCILEGREARSMEVAEAQAQYWMRGYCTYVDTGVFPDPGGRVKV